MQHAQKRKMLTGLTLASSLAWMSILPATAVFAQSGPMVTPGSVTLSGPTTSTLNGSATFSASAQDPNGTAEYQFWVEEPNGQWVDGQNYSTSNTFTLSTPSAGDYLVAVDVMDKTEVAAGQWNLAQTTLSDGVFVDSSVTVTSNATGSVAKGTPITLTATASNIYDPVYQFWVETPSGEWMQSGNYQTSNMWTFTPASGGTYKFVAYAKSPLAANNPHGALQSNVGDQVAYGTAAQVVASPATQSVVADGAASGTVTFTVEDSHGDRVANFNGTLTLTDYGMGLGISKGGVNSGDVYTVTDGQASAMFSVPTGDAGDTISISADDLTNAVTGQGGISGQGQVANINYSMATAMVSGVAEEASGIMLTATTSALANNYIDHAKVTAQITDQAGQPYVANNPYYVKLSITGPGSFNKSNWSDTSEVVELAPSHGSEDKVPIFTQLGATSPVTINATQVSGSLLTPASPLTFDMYEVVGGDHLAISSSVSTGPVDGLTYTTYTVALEDSAGQVITRRASGQVDPNGTGGVSSTSGNLVYDNTTPQGETGQPATSTGFTMTEGVGTFTVENTGYESTPATINVTYGNLSGSVLYTYTKGLGEYATLTQNSTDYAPDKAGSGFQGGYATVTAGETVDPTAQLADYYGNPVQEAGQSIYFRIDEAGVASLPNGATGLQDVYHAYTNADGQATIPISILTSDMAGQHLYVETEGSALNYIENGGKQGGLDLSLPYVVVPTDDYATSISTTLSGGTLAAGASANGTVSAFNSADGPIGATPWTTVDPSATNTATGIIEVTSLEPNVVGVGKQGVATEYVQLGSDGEVTLPPLIGGMAGTAQIELTDVSTGATLTAPITYTVVPSEPLLNALLYYNGAPVGSTNEATASGGQVTELWVKNVDAGGNPIDVTGTTPLEVWVPRVEYGEWATSLGGVASTTGVFVQIQPGQSSAPVFLEGLTTDTSTETATVSSSIAMDAAQQLSFVPSALTMVAGYSAATSKDVTVSADTLYGKPVSSGVPIWLSLNTGRVTGGSATVDSDSVSLSATPYEVTTSGGSATVDITDPEDSVAGTSMYVTAQNEAMNPTVTATLPVSIVQPMLNAQLYVNGAPISSSNEVNLSSSATDIYVENVDTAGNAFEVPSNSTGLTVILPAENGVTWGDNKSSDTSAVVTIEPGSSSVEVNVTGTATLSSQIAMDAVQNLVMENSSGVSIGGTKDNTMTSGEIVDVLPENLYGASLPSASVTMSFNSGTTYATAAASGHSLSAKGATINANAAGQIQVVLTPGTNGKYTTAAVLSATVSGLSVSASFDDLHT